MRGDAGLLWTLLPALAGCWLPAQATFSRCDHGPGDGVIGARSRPEGKFKIFLNGEPEVYNPGEMYTVTLKSLEPWFVWFSLWAEAGQGNTGTLHPFGDSTTKNNVHCPALITAASPHPKQEASSLWSAPATGSGCVTFKATVVVQRDIWYQEDGPLSYTICENLGQTNDEQPPVNRECCACDEAKYEVGFEGLWSRQTHPKDFPDKNITRFSDVIGASHTTQYSFWDYGGIASEGLKEVAEHGSTRTLESELKSQSQHIRTIIKARGIAYPNITSKTFAVFRVDSKHHLISLVSMLAPSPDWIVGVSGLELCLSNCSWIESKVMNLYPWDAGTDSGISYLSPKNKTEPKDHIRRITSSFPNDPRSPFYDPLGEPMKPLAKLYLTRQRLYEKTCETNPEQDNGEACSTREWGEWSDCSVTCGVGTRTRQRFYKSERKAQEAGCQEELTSRVPCYQPRPCRLDGSDEWWEDGEPRRDGYPAPHCQFTPWSSWSQCSVVCGQGKRHRFRRLLNKRSWKECMYVYRPPPIKQEEPCEGQLGPVCPSEPTPLMVNCTTKAWSEWSPCSVSCGQGKQFRTRRVIGTGCNGVQVKEEMFCVELPDCRLKPEEARDVCMLGKPPSGSADPCRGQFEKYYFELSSGSCVKFISGGCPLTRNQFETADDCESACGFIRDEMANSSETPEMINGQLRLNEGQYNYYTIDESSAGGTVPPLFPGIKSASILDSMAPVTGVEGPVLDCITSQWTDWGPCSTSCGLGYRKKTRHILRNARNGGKACPKKLLKTKRCNIGPCSGNLLANDNVNMPDYEDEEYRTRECVYSSWTQWTPCSPPCGLNSIQQRTRAVDQRRSPPNICRDRMETRVCNVPPCTR